MHNALVRILCVLGGGVMGLAGAAVAAEPDRAGSREPGESFHASSGDQLTTGDAIPVFGIQVSQRSGVEITGPGRTRTVETGRSLIWD